MPTLRELVDASGLPRSGGGLRPQVQDQYGRSPSDPNYGRPPGPGETVPNPAGRLAATTDIYGKPLAGGSPADDWFAQQGAPPTLTTPGGPVPGAPPAPGAPSGGRMSDAQAQQFFDQLFPGETVTPEQLAAARPQLEAAGFTLNPNATGRITDLTLPSGNTVDPIYGAGSGENRKQWLVHPGGAAGGAAGPGGAFASSPDYQFRLGEGMKALERSAASRGTLLTGGTLKGLQRYAQDVASGEFQNRFNRLNTLAGMGQQAAGAQATLGSAYAGQAGNLLSNQAQQTGDLLTQGGNAAAAGTAGRAQAIQDTLGQGANLAQLYYLSRLLQPGGTVPGTTGPYPVSGTTTGGQPLRAGNPSVPGFGGWADPYADQYAWLRGVPGYRA